MATASKNGNAAETAPEPVKESRLGVGATVPKSLHDFIEEHKWANRLTKSQVIENALTEWAKAHGYEVPETAKA